MVFALSAQENTTEDNVVEVVSEIEELVANTTSTLDQTQMNFDVITGVVNISRQIIVDTDLNSEDVVEVMWHFSCKIHQRNG